MAKLTNAQPPASHPAGWASGDSAELKGTEMKPTKKQMMILREIATCKFSNKFPIEENQELYDHRKYGQPVRVKEWSENLGIAPTSGRGIFRSLIKSGLIWFESDEEYNSGHTVCGMTAKGIELYEASGGIWRTCIFQDIPTLTALDYV